MNLKKNLDASLVALQPTSAKMQRVPTLPHITRGLGGTTLVFQRSCSKHGLGSVLKRQ